MRWVERLVYDLNKLEIWTKQKSENIDNPLNSNLKLKITLQLIATNEIC